MILAKIYDCSIQSGGKLKHNQETTLVFFDGVSAETTAEDLIPMIERQNKHIKLNPKSIIKIITNSQAK